MLLSYPNIQIPHHNQIPSPHWPPMVTFLNRHFYIKPNPFLHSNFSNYSPSYLPISTFHIVFQNIENKLTSHFGRFQITKHNGFAILHLVLRNKFDQATNNGPWFLLTNVDLLDVQGVSIWMFFGGPD